MDQYLGSNKLATYLHPGPTGPFLEMKSEPMKPPSPITSGLLHHNPSLIDLCTFNSLCQRFMEDSSSSNTSPHKPLVTPSDLYFCLPEIPKMNVSQSTAQDTSTKSILQPETTASPISSAGECSPNVSSSVSTPYSSPKVKQLLQNPSPVDFVTIKESSPLRLSQNGHHSTSPDGAEQLQDLIRQVDPSFDGSLLKVTPEKVITTSPTKSLHTSPILHRLLTSPTKSAEIPFNAQSNQSSPEREQSVTSPQYQARYSPYYSSEHSPTVSSQSHSPSKHGKSSRQLCRSPMFSRSNHKTDQNHLRHDRTTSHCETSSVSISLLSANSEDDRLIDEHQNINSISPSSQKRSLETPSTEPTMNKRRCPPLVPTMITQQDYCISYPSNIPRCIDCQTANPMDFSLHLAGCRFQYCRKLTHNQDDSFELAGFTTSVEMDPQETEYLCTPNSCEQPLLNLTDANYVFMRISKLFSLMFLHEQTDRSKKDEKTIIWRRYMPGWREVCDECFTTLFNCHYMCEECGYMICLECSNQFAQLNLDKRKRLKRLCSHENSFTLSEFIPWNTLLKLRNNTVDYLSRLKLDYTMKVYPSTKTDNLSMFIKSLKMKRSHDAREAQKLWSSKDCNEDSNIEFYCHGRLPVFNEWQSENAKEFFRKVWSSSSPVLVKQVHRNLSTTLWKPKAFKEHMIDHRETPALWDCETLTPIQTNETILSQFWDGFECLDIRLKDEENGGRPRILKLKDWPTKKDFASVFPTRLHDLMANIPFSDYTRRSYTYNGINYHAGVMNIVERLPTYLVKPDLGPKLYIAYSQLTSQATKKAGTTNLHIDVSDAVNVLVYVGVGGHGSDGSDNEEEIRQVKAEILESNIDEAQLQRLRNGERPGALWHLFRSDDAKKIREYIGRMQRKQPGTDSIHDQTTYLEKEDLDKLREWSQVESYPIVQFLGDAIFIPSGAPHQVKNLHSCIKIAEDFVSPENLDRCLITTNEFRSLSKTHTNHADILQAKNILYYVTRDAFSSLTESIDKNENSTDLNSSTVHN